MVRPAAPCIQKKKWSNGAFICLCVCALLNMTQYEIDCCFPSGYKSLYCGSSHYPFSFYSPILFHPSLLSSYHPVISHSEVSFFQILARIFGLYRNTRAPFKRSESCYLISIAFIVRQGCVSTEHEAAFKITVKNLPHTTVLTVITIAWVIESNLFLAFFLKTYLNLFCYFLCYCWFFFLLPAGGCMCVCLSLVVCEWKQVEGGDWTDWSHLIGQKD